jgi:FkbM family methyltransferase
MKKLIQKLIRSMGYEIHRHNAKVNLASGVERGSVEGSLAQVQALGFMPKTVIDVGAAIGSFTRTCYAIFPQAQYVLLEPLEEYVPSLKQVVNAIPRAAYEIAVAAANEGTAPLNVHEDLVGSSLYRESEEGANVNGVRREVRSLTLDRLIVERSLRPPYLVKIDVQGAELDVLRGGEALLGGAEYVLMEMSLFQFFQNGPLFCDMVSYMESKGFVPYDIIGPQYRPLDWALSQVDVVFVKESGIFRQRHYYATPEQRQEQNQQIRSYLQSLLSSK